MAYAYQQGSEPLQRKLAESFFRGYFEQEQNPGDRKYLVKTVTETGVFPSEDKANAFLDSDELKDQIKTGYREAKEMGVNGVPFFVFGDKYAVSGAQPPDVLLEVFEKLAEERAPAQAA